MKAFLVVFCASLIGAARATSCDPGYFLNDNVCTLCDWGQYNNEYGATECKNCGPGSYHRDDRTICNGCAAGFYSNLVRNQLCFACPNGWYSNMPNGADECTRCDAGTYSDERANDYFNEQYSSTDGSISCKYCQMGTFSSAGASACTNCAVGKFSASSGASACTDCDVGTYSDESGASSCKACSGNTQYMDEVGALSCKECPETRRTNATHCIPLCTDTLKENCECPDDSSDFEKIYRIDNTGKCVQISTYNQTCDISATQQWLSIKNVTECYAACGENCIGFVHAGVEGDANKYCAVYSGNEACDVVTGTFEWDGYFNWHVSMNLILAPINETHVLCDWDESLGSCSCGYESCSDDEKANYDVKLYENLYPRCDVTQQHRLPYCMRTCTSDDITLPTCTTI